MSDERLELAQAIRRLEARTAALERVEANTATATWTPALAFGGGSTGITYTTRTGSTVRMGKLVWFVGVVVLSNKGSSTGTAKITGLPGTAAGYAPVTLLAYSVSGLSGLLQGLVEVTSSAILLYDMAHSAAASLATDADFANTSALYLSGMYQVA